MADTQAQPQPGSPEQIHRVLPLGSFGSYLVLGGIFCVLAAVGFARLATGIFADQFVSFDTSVITWLHGYWGPTTDLIMLFFTTIGDMPVLTLLLALVAVALLRFRRWIDAFGLILAGAGAGLLNQLLKELFHRVRPDLFAGPFHLTSYSFPSGHAMGSIACYGMLAFVVGRLARGRLGRVALALVAAVIVLGVGLSRVFFGVHYPTDVLGGFLAGGIWLVIAIAAVEAAEWHARRRQQRA